MDKTSTGLTENIAGLLFYVLGWVSSLVFVLIEQQNKFVRFYAVQSIVTFGGITIISIALSILGFILFLGVVFDIANWIIGILAFVLWIVLIVKASQGIKYKLPWAGEYAENINKSKDRSTESSASLQCKVCGQDNSSEAVFCSKCGGPLAVK